MTARDDAMEEMRAALEPFAKDFTDDSWRDDDTLQCMSDGEVHFIIKVSDLRRAAKALASAQAPTPPSDESPVGERKPYPDGFIISESEAAARCPGLHASCWRAYDKLTKENDELRATPQPERVTEARVEAGAKAILRAQNRKRDWDTAYETDKVLALSYSRAALEASLSIPSEGEGVPDESTPAMEDAARSLWLWYSGCRTGSDWTLGKHNEAGGYKLPLTEWEAAQSHLPKANMSRICWRTMLRAYRATLPQQGEG